MSCHKGCHNVINSFTDTIDFARIHNALDIVADHGVDVSKERVQLKSLQHELFKLRQMKQFAVKFSTTLLSHY
ncbi:hypothetical protein KCM76_24585 [Zooshikella marina]|uniref:hypothetical protein n=1 Tax=Zooshikella ganghwensis TaxID=202772 RepID=UPI001BAFF7D8|nr:hypothetical protein [Zooshikella ganghwensis]MBU2709196.1 hypothetical protein [Zooshikella ganghwensis]